MSPIAFGAFIDSTDPTAIGAFATLVGRPPASISFYVFRKLADGSDGPGFPAGQANAIAQAGATPVIAFRQNGMPATLVATGHDDAYWTAWFTAAARWGKPIYFRFDWEMNVGLTAAPSDWVAQWLHLHDLSRACGAANLRWVWNVNVAYYGTTDIALLWPGPATVDWTAIDGYNWGHHDQYHWWTDLATVFKPTYDRVLSLAPRLPMMLAETSSADDGTGDKGQWWRDGLLNGVPNLMPAVHAVTVFSVDKRSSGECDWRVDSSTTSLQGFKDALQATYQPPPAQPPPAALYSGRLG